MSPAQPTSKTESGEFDVSADATPQRISTWKRKILKALSDSLSLSEEDEQELADKIHNYLTGRKDWEIDLVAEVFHEGDTDELLHLIDTNKLPGEEDIADTTAEPPTVEVMEQDPMTPEIGQPDILTGEVEVDKVATETSIGEAVAPPPTKPKKKTPPSVRGTRVKRSTTETGRRMVDMVDQYKQLLEAKNPNAVGIFLRMCELALRSPESDALNSLFKLFADPQLCVQDSLFFDRISKGKTTSPAQRLNVFYNIMKSTATHIANGQKVTLSASICRRRLSSGGSSKVRSNADRIVSFIFEKVDRVSS